MNIKRFTPLPTPLHSCIYFSFDESERCSETMYKFNVEHALKNDIQQPPTLNAKLDLFQWLKIIRGMSKS
jgi:hypothetical protein